MKNKRILVFAFLLLIVIASFAIGLGYIRNAKEEQLKVTGEHPFYIQGEWIKAKDLKIGDKLTTSDGRVAVINSVMKVAEKVKVYNMHVDSYETYFANNILVHNKDGKNINALVRDKLNPLYYDPAYSYRAQPYPASDYKELFPGIAEYDPSQFSEGYKLHRKNLIQKMEILAAILRRVYGWPRDKVSLLLRYIKNHDYTKADELFNEVDMILEQGETNTMENALLIKHLQFQAGREWDHRLNVAPLDYFDPITGKTFNLREILAPVSPLDSIDASQYRRPEKFFDIDGLADEYMEGAYTRPSGVKQPMNDWENKLPIDKLKKAVSGSDLWEGGTSEEKAEHVVKVAKVATKIWVRIKNAYFNGEISKEQVDALFTDLEKLDDDTVDILADSILDEVWANTVEEWEGIDYIKELYK